MKAVMKILHWNLLKYMFSNNQVVVECNEKNFFCVHALVISLLDTILIFKKRVLYLAVSSLLLHPAK